MFQKPQDPSSSWLYFPRPLFLKRDWRDESEIYDKSDPKHKPPSLSLYDKEKAPFIADVHVAEGGEFFGRPAIHWFVCFGIITTFIFWTVVLAMDFSHVFSSMNHYEVMRQFTIQADHPRTVFDQGVVLQLPHKLVWYIMWCLGYAMSAIATIIVFFHVTGTLPAFKNIFYDVGVFFPIFNLFAALGEMSIAIAGSEDITETQRNGYWRLAEASTGILFFGAAYVFVFCRQRRSSINILVWQCSVGFVNILFVNAYVAFALVVSCSRSITTNVRGTAPSGIAFVLFGVMLLLYLADLSATFWYRTFGVYSSLRKEEWNDAEKYPDLTRDPVDNIFKWTPSIYNTLMPAIYFAGLLAAWKDPVYDWDETAARYRHPVVAAAIMGVSLFSLLTLHTAGRAFAKYQHERNGDPDEAAVTLDFNRKVMEVGVDKYATMRI